MSRGTRRAGVSSSIGPRGASTTSEKVGVRRVEVVSLTIPTCKMVPLSPGHELNILFAENENMMRGTYRSAWLFTLGALLVSGSGFTETAAAQVTATQVTEALSSALKPVPRSGNWMKRHESMNQRVKQGNVDLVFIGDSITQGWEGSGKQVWQKFYGDRNAVNLGIGGDRTQHVIWRLDNGNLEGISPKLAVIMIGTNNSGSNTSEEIADGVKHIVSQLREKSPSTKILVLGIFPRGANDQDSKRTVNNKANEIIAKSADGESVVYLDIGEKFLSEDRTLSREIMPDLLHLSDKGYNIWAEAIEPSVKKLMGEDG
jgi:lysophospholipase L1-like esterase